MKLRVLTAVVLIPIVVALIWFAPPLLLAGAAALVAIFALNEFFDLAARQGATGFKKWTIACSAALFYAQYSLGLVETRNLNGAILLINGGEGRTLSLEAVLLIFVLGVVTIGLFTHRSLQEVLPAVSVSAAGLLFVAYPFSYLVRLNEMPILGRRLVLFALCMVWAGDMLAYFVGRHWVACRWLPRSARRKPGRARSETYLDRCLWRWHLRAGCKWMWSISWSSPLSETLLGKWGISSNRRSSAALR